MRITITIVCCLIATSPIEHASQGLTKFEGTELRNLRSNELSQLRVQFQALTGEVIKTDWKDPKPWLIKPMDDGSGSWLMLNVYPGFGVPDVSFVEFHLFDKAWKRIEKQKFPTGYRMFVTDAKLVREPVLSADVLIIKTVSAGPFLIQGDKKQPAFEQGDYQLQHYALVGNQLRLIRLSDDKNRLVRNSYRWSRPMKGPEVPKLSPEEWLKSSSSTNSAEVLSVLVWLSGEHISSNDSRSTGLNREPVEASKIFETIRDSSQTKQLLQTLKESKNKWIRDYAALASEALSNP